MRVKVGDKWYEATAEQPIMVELDSFDKANITNMTADANRYALFHDNCELSVPEKIDWMNEGATIALGETIAL